MEPDYHAVFERLGRVLGPADAFPEAALAEAERHLGCALPRPLRDFYATAGGATDFTDHYDHFLPPGQWSLEGGKLVFLTENQAVVLYAVDTLVQDPDPPVLMANNAEPYEWHQGLRPLL